MSITPIIDNLWQTPPEELCLSVNDVHIWRIALDIPANPIAELKETLTPDERQRAERFYFEKDRKRFIACRGLLRQILARYLNLAPEQLRFAYGSHGKPELANTNIGDRIFFNVSHSQDLALFAITKARFVGIDLEYRRPMPDAQQLAKRFFSHREYEIISSLLPPQQEEMFFRIWTVKEAFLKATGEGLVGLQQVEVSLIPDESVNLEIMENDSLTSKHWFCRELNLARNYIGALVVEGNDWDLHYFAPGWEKSSKLQGN